METNIKRKVLDGIGKIYEDSKNCKLEHDFFASIDRELTFLSGYFITSKSQAFFIAMVFALNYKGDTVDLNDLIKYFDCNPMKILEFNEDFEYLYSVGIFTKHQSKHRPNLKGTNDQFTVNQKISEAILQNKSMPELKQGKINDVVELLEKIYQMGVQRNIEEISSNELFAKTGKLISTNLHFPLIKKINQLQLEIEDSYVYLYLIWKSLSGHNTTGIGRAMESIFDKATERVHYMQKFALDENVLIQNNLVETVDAHFFNDTEMRLTERSKDLLNECGIKLFHTRKKDGNILSPSQIPFRKLIFDELEMKQLFMLKGLLEDVKFAETQKRLSEKNLPKGITVLLHGVPGTGKTEIVKQLAKETQRELMKVEISQSKSSWFGESEKIIRKIFTDYHSFSKECERTPILLFNEADAIISKRREIGNSSVAQTENAIQNIILEELENFEGILIATTNLASHLDTAFERRFLFKIPFQKPGTSIRAKIWESKLPSLKFGDCNLLAEKFDFSGGQIDNIIRKQEIHEIIHGESVTLENLLSFCSEETLGSERVKVGFKNIHC